jgi:prepilin-type N-terminal cleavage/methylation domain-containing protein
MTNPLSNRTYTKGITRNRSGFSMIELLISSSLAGVMVTGFLTATTGFFHSDSQQRQTVVTQQNMRFAADQMADDIRQAAYIFTDPAVAYGQISGSAPTVPTASGNTPTPVLALLTPELDSNSQPTGKFRLVVYSTGIKPASQRYQLATSIHGKMLYRWISKADHFDPVSQVQTLGGTNYAPSGLAGNFLIYGGSLSDLYPTPIVGNIDHIQTNMDTAPNWYGSSATSVGIVLYSDVVNTEPQANQKDIPQQQTYLVARNVGLPINPMSTVGVASGTGESCLTTGNSAVCPTTASTATPTPTSSTAWH